MMIKPPTYCRILQVDPEAGIQIIRYSYRRLTAKYRGNRRSDFHAIELVDYRS